ncbi:hypothetical protein CEXT_695611 [Caerostris extrusa]|uniref:Uncharacterized protein n=1 Tax=Caerostris extrusa TaxID=172846 RepID=A0AAV4SP75_CAEEX|nr:hypothetical protein CEXT_695611 [Caerostris extrusa]
MEEKVSNTLGTDLLWIANVFRGAAAQIANVWGRIDRFSSDPKQRKGKYRIPEEQILWIANVLCEVRIPEILKRGGTSVGAFKVLFYYWGSPSPILAPISPKEAKISLRICKNKEAATRVEHFCSFLCVKGAAAQRAKGLLRYFSRKQEHPDKFGEIPGAAALKCRRPFAQRSPEILKWAELLSGLSEFCSITGAPPPILAPTSRKEAKSPAVGQQLLNSDVPFRQKNSRNSKAGGTSVWGFQSSVLLLGLSSPYSRTHFPQKKQKSLRSCLKRTKRLDRVEHFCSFLCVKGAAAQIGEA